MKILFDQGTPAPLRGFLAGHQVTTAYEEGWSELSNGRLIAAAEQAGFDLLITTDRNLKYQQNLRDRRLAILVLLSTSWPRIRVHAAKIAVCAEGMAAGQYAEFPLA